ncbi:uncharacterized protein N7459_005986 [Penicillium hispanicum]|uniref:uncharacterized protein n=1 Tax=Penicillium hispanicum TaxID=1080232 RepID=UPI00253FD9AE|nr:uncharacterized protein N7459_005986 [Penicillium hispanicum]KAJ5580001.1 hypothetical protein N7459_005986 [Penicillium hispanicum]
MDPENPVTPPRSASKARPSQSDQRSAPVGPQNTTYGGPVAIPVAQMGIEHIEPGPWPHCIVFPNDLGIITACANCTWNGQHKRCTFYIAPATLTPANRRGQLSQAAQAVQDSWVERLMGRTEQLVRSVQELRTTEARQHPFYESLQRFALEQADIYQNTSAQLLTASVNMSDNNPLPNQIDDVLAQLDALEGEIRGGHSDGRWSTFALFFFFLSVILAMEISMELILSAKTSLITLSHDPSNDMRSRSCSP